MTYQDIEAFLEIIQSGSISRAANNLAVTQPTLSHRLKALENELGTNLIKREKGIRNIELTETGRNFIPIAEKWKRLWVSTVALATQQEVKTIRVAAAHSISTYVMPIVYRRFLEHQPDLTISLYTQHSSEAYRAMETGEADIAFIANPLYSKRVTTTPLFKEEMVLISGNEEFALRKAVAPSELTAGDEILLDWSREFFLWHEYWFGSDPRPRIFTDDMNILENFICQDKAWAIAPLSAARTIMTVHPHIRIYDLRDAPPDRITYKLATQAQGQKHEVQNLVEMLKDHVNESEGFTLYGE